MIYLGEFHGLRPRLDPRLLGNHEAQVAENCRLYSGTLAAWRKPANVHGVGRNYLIRSNQFDALGGWARTGLDSVDNDATTAPDGFDTADKLLEDTSTGLHMLAQGAIAKTAAAQFWTASISLKAAERTFAWLRLGTNDTNCARVFINLDTGEVSAVALFGTYTLGKVEVEEEDEGFYRLHLIATTGPESTTGIAFGTATSLTTASFLGTLNSGIYAYGASLRDAAKKGPYRETVSTSRPTDPKSFNLWNESWFVFPQRANVVRPSAAGDNVETTIITGGGYSEPAFTYDPIAITGGDQAGDMPRQVYSLGLPIPATGPVAALAPPGGTVTNVTNVIASKADQTVASFTLAATTLGETVAVQCNFRTEVIPNQIFYGGIPSGQVMMTFRIKRGTIVIAAITQPLALQLTPWNYEPQDVQYLLTGEDTPPAGDHTYTFEASVQTVPPGSAILAEVHDHTQIQVRSINALVTTGAAHNLVVGNKVGIRNVLGFEDINKPELEVLSVPSSNTFMVAVSSKQVFSGAGVWARYYADDGDRQDTGYVMTWLSTIGNKTYEGPPSALSNLVARGLDEPVTLSSLPTAPSVDGSSYNVTGKRLYRTNVDSDGNAAFQFLADLALNATTYTDSKLPTELGEVIPSTDWIKPPANMQGVVDLHDGVLAGFAGNEVCFCEPYQPHAWPVKYRLAFGQEIVALASFGASTAVLTKGKPSVINGNTPGEMRVERIELSSPCVSAEGVVDMGYAVLYPSDDGISMISTGDIKNVTKGLFTRREWQELRPSTIQAARYDDRYVAFYTKADGTQAGFIFDPNEPAATFTQLNFGVASLWTDPATGDLYALIDEYIALWDAGPTYYRMKWRSKQYHFDYPRNYAFARVDAVKYPVTLNVYTNRSIKEHGDLVLRHTKMVYDGEAISLPGGFLANSVEIEIAAEGDAIVRKVILGRSMREISEAPG